MSRQLAPSLKRPGPIPDADAESPAKRSKNRSEHEAPGLPNSSTGQASIARGRESFASIYGRREPPKSNVAGHAKSASPHTRPSNPNADTAPLTASSGPGNRTAPEAPMVTKRVNSDGRGQGTSSLENLAIPKVANGVGAKDTAPSMLPSLSSEGSTSVSRNTEANGPASTSPADRRAHDLMSSILDVVRWDSRYASAEAAIHRAEQRRDLVDGGSKHNDERAAAQANLRSEESRRDLAANKMALAESHLYRLIHGSLPRIPSCSCDASKLDETNVRVQALTDQVDALKEQIEKLSRGHDALAVVEAENRTDIFDLRNAFINNEGTRLTQPAGQHFPTYYNERIGELGLRSSQHKRRGERLDEAYTEIERQRRQFESSHDMVAEGNARLDQNTYQRDHETRRNLNDREVEMNNATRQGISKGPKDGNSNNMASNGRRTFNHVDTRLNEERREPLSGLTALETEHARSRESTMAIATKVIQDGQGTLNSIKRALYGGEEVVAAGLPLIVRMRQLEEAHRSLAKTFKDHFETQDKQNNVLVAFTKKTVEYQRVTDELRIMVGNKAGFGEANPLVTRVLQLEGSRGAQDERLTALEARIEAHANASHAADRTGTAINHHDRAYLKAIENATDTRISEVAHVTNGHAKAIEDLRSVVRRLEEISKASQHAAVNSANRAAHVEPSTSGALALDRSQATRTPHPRLYPVPFQAPQRSLSRSGPSTSPHASGNSPSPHPAPTANHQAGYVSSASAYTQNVQVPWPAQTRHPASVTNVRTGGSSSPYEELRPAQGAVHARSLLQPALPASQPTNSNTRQHHPPYVPNIQPPATDIGRMVASINTVQQQIRNIVGAVQSLEQRQQNIRIDDIIQHVLNYLSQHTPQGQDILDLVRQIPTLTTSLAQLDHRMQLHNTSLINTSNSVDRFDAEITSVETATKRVERQFGLLNPKVEDLEVWRAATVDRFERMIAACNDLQAWRADAIDRIDQISTEHGRLEAWRADVTHKFEMVVAAHDDQLSSVIAHTNDINEIKAFISELDPSVPQTTEDDPTIANTDPAAVKTARLRLVNRTRASTANDTAKLDELGTKVSGFELLIDASKAAMAELRHRLEDVETLDGKFDNEIKNITFLKENMEQVRKHAGMKPVDFASRSWTPPTATAGASRRG